MGISLDSRPPWGLRRLGLTCLYTRLTPSTTPFFSSPGARTPLPAPPPPAAAPPIPPPATPAPPSRPYARASPPPPAPPGPSPPRPRSPLAPRLGTLTSRPALHHLRRQVDDADETALAQLAGDGAEDARAARVLLGVD